MLLYRKLCPHESQRKKLWLSFLNPINGRGNSQNILRVWFPSSWSHIPHLAPCGQVSGDFPLHLPHTQIIHSENKSKSNPSIKSGHTTAVLSLDNFSPTFWQLWIICNKVVKSLTNPRYRGRIDRKYVVSFSQLVTPLYQIVYEK